MPRGRFVSISIEVKMAEAKKCPRCGADMKRKATCCRVVWSCTKCRWKEVSRKKKK